MSEAAKVKQIQGLLTQLLDELVALLNEAETHIASLRGVQELETARSKSIFHFLRDAGKVRFHAPVSLGNLRYFLLSRFARALCLARVR